MGARARVALARQDVAPPHGVTAPHADLTSERERRYWRAALLVTWLATLVRLLFAFRLPLFPDETYYWEWSRPAA
jgi:hypothetical protein